jgi:NAD(P)H dehydrogenase (quinone)
MNDIGSILETGAAGQLGAVGRTVTGLLLDRELPVRAMVRAAALRAAGAKVVVGDLLEPADVYRVRSGIGGSTSACPHPPVTWKRP